MDLLKALGRAFDLGVNFVDTAEAYGDGESERIVGEAVRGRDVFVATKLAGTNAGSPRKHLLRSLERLQTKSVDLYQLHWPPSYYTNLVKVLREMESLIDEGLTRYIGLSNFSGELLEKTLTYTKKHEVVSNQVQYNLLYRTSETTIANTCRASGVEIIAWSPLAKGALTGKPPSPESNYRWRKRDSVYGRVASAKDLLDYIAQLAREKGVKPVQIALAWLIRKGAFPIPGVKNQSQAEDIAKTGETDISQEEENTLDGLSASFRTPDYLSFYSRALPNLFMKPVIKYMG